MATHEFKAIRKKLGYTQKELAPLIGVSIKSVQAYESGSKSFTRNPSKSVIMLLKKVKPKKEK